MLFLGGLLVSVRRITPAPHLDDLGSGSLLDSIFAITLAALILFLAAGLGSLLIKPFKLNGWTFIERTVIGLPIGLAVMAYGVFFMGLAGWIKPIHLIAWLIIIGIISFRSGVIFLEEAFSQLQGFAHTWSNFSLIKKVIFSAGVLTLLLALFQSFTPPWDYDGLLYHLQGPRLFLQEGRIIPLYSNWVTFYPFTWEMLYMLGMGLGSDIFARLIHFSTLILLLLATYAFGRRFLPKPGGWLATVILAGIPILPLWGNAAYTDMPLALFQFLAIVLVVLWINEKRNILLILAGIMQGFVLGIKYTAFTGAVILVILILFYCYRNKAVFPSKLKSYTPMLFFGITTLIIACPWYIKNLIWTGNPSYPFLFPQNKTDPIQLVFWIDYMNSFGVGRTWMDFLLLPIDLFIHHNKFGTFLGSMDMPSPLFLSIFLYPVFRKHQSTKVRGFLDALIWVTLGQFFAWALGVQQNRFLMPLYPGICIIVSSIFVTIFREKKYRFIGKVLFTGLACGMILVSIIFMSIYIDILKPAGVLLAYESKQEFLNRMVGDSRGIEYINTRLPENSKVMFFWDGRGYYCDQKCIPDIDQMFLTAAITTSTKILDLSQLLINKEFTHLLMSKEDALFFILMHDKGKLHKQAYDFFMNEFAPNCASEIYSDKNVILYEFQPNNVTCK